VQGAVWLEADKTSPYDYYQFFRNTMDDDVERYLGLFTFLPMEEVTRLGALKPPILNRAKEILAFEATMINHGRDEAIRAFRASVEKFGEADKNRSVETSSVVTEADSAEAESPSVALKAELLRNNFTVIDAFVHAGLASSRGEARRLVRQGGAYVNGERVDDENLPITEKDFQEKVLDLRAGKKRHMDLVIE
jgi:tyrosyl-tRNA synthetase